MSPVTGAEALREEILALEQRLLDPAVRRDAAALAALLDPDFTEIGQSGRLWDRAAVLADLPAETEADFSRTVTEFALREVAPGIALASYRIPESATRRSSLWRRSEAGWRLLFHQGTPQGL